MWDVNSATGVYFPASSKYLTLDKSTYHSLGDLLLNQQYAFDEVFITSTYRITPIAYNKYLSQVIRPGEISYSNEFKILLTTKLHIFVPFVSPIYMGLSSSWNFSVHSH